MLKFGDKRTCTATVQEIMDAKAVFADAQSIYLTVKSVVSVVNFSVRFWTLCGRYDRKRIQPTDSKTWRGMNYF